MKYRVRLHPLMKRWPLQPFTLSNCLSKGLSIPFMYIGTQNALLSPLNPNLYQDFISPPVSEMWRRSEGQIQELSVPDSIGNPETHFISLTPHSIVLDLPVKPEDDLRWQRWPYMIRDTADRAFSGESWISDRYGYGEDACFVLYSSSIGLRTIFSFQKHED